MPGTPGNPLRAGLVALCVVALVALFVALRPGGGSPSGGGGAVTATPTRATPTEGPGSPTRGPSEAPASPTRAPEAREVEIEVEEGRVVGPAEVTVDRGERIVLIVEADVADEVHVHGYDLLADVRPGRPARIAFVADAPGVFEVELESAGLLLTRLEVRP